MSHYDELLNPVHLPRMYLVKQKFDNKKIEKSAIEGTTARVIADFPGIDRIRGKSVALAVGSRGINNLVTITRACAKALAKQGADVFITPAMGSHGGCEAEGQRKLLEHLGVSEQSIGVPIRSGMETVVIGETPDGVPVNYDRNAAAADFTVSIARIKPHSSFRGKYESGMVKMCVIGLGKQKGADYCHAQGMANMGRNLEKIGRVILEKSNLLFSLGIIENGYDDTMEIMAVPAAEILDREPPLLEKAKSLLPKIPFENLDLLVVDEFGKNITGTGFDSTIVQRFTSEHMSATARPVSKRLVTLRLTPESDGNASGFGFADVATKRVLQAMSPEKTYPNSLTARTVRGSFIPIIMENDFDTIRAGIKTAPDVDYGNMRIVRIRNTLRLDVMHISEALRGEAAANPALTVREGPFDWKFDGDGNLSEESDGLQ